MNARLATAILVLLLAACSKLTLENYDRLKSGMGYQEVKEILGAPANAAKCWESRVAPGEMTSASSR